MKLTNRGSEYYLESESLVEAAYLDLLSVMMFVPRVATLSDEGKKVICLKKEEILTLKTDLKNWVNFIVNNSNSVLINLETV